MTTNQPLKVRPYTVPEGMLMCLRLPGARQLETLSIPYPAVLRSANRSLSQAI